MQQETTPCRFDEDNISKDASLSVVFDRYPGNVPYDTNKMTEMLNRRYGKRCLICGDYWGIIHHKDCNRNNNDINNLMPLCIICHRRWHSLHPNWRYLTDKEILDIVEEGAVF